MLEDSKFCLLIGQLRVSHLFRNGGDEPWLVSSYETKPQRGWMKRPKVPRTHTVTNTQRKILSITMATYFQSSSTCEQGREQDQWVWDDRGKCQQWQMQDEKWGEIFFFFFIKAREERCTVRGSGWVRISRRVGGLWESMGRITQPGWQEGMKQRKREKNWTFLVSQQ